MNLSVKPNFKEVGKVFGSLIKEFQTKLLELDMDKVNALQKGNSITMEINGEEKEVTPSMVEIRISSKEGYNVGMENNNFVILDTTLTEELVLEGIAREMISKVQNIRKESDYNIVDRIELYYNGDETVNKAVDKFNEFIKKETLAVEIIVKEDINSSYDLNGHEVFIETKKR